MLRRRDMLYVAQLWSGAGGRNSEGGSRRWQTVSTKSIELVGTSTESWEKAATTAVEMAAKSLRGLRIAEIVELDMQLEEGEGPGATAAKVKVVVQSTKGGEWRHQDCCNGPAGRWWQGHCFVSRSVHPVPD